MGIQRKLVEFMRYFEGLPYPGILILKNESERSVMKRLSGRGYTQSASWKELLQNLAAGKSTVLLLTDPLPKEIYDSIVQYAARRGTVQIFDKCAGAWQGASCDPSRTHLLLLVGEREFAALDHRYQFKEKVELIEYV